MLAQTLQAHLNVCVFFLPEVCRVLWGYMFSILFAEKLKEILKLKMFVKTLKKGKVISGHAKLLSF